LNDLKKLLEFLDLKPFWCCSHCEKRFSSERRGLNHLTTMHVSVGVYDTADPDDLVEFSSKYQQKIIMRQARDEYGGK